MNATLLAMLLLSATVDYKAVIAEAERTGKPVVVLVGAEWCGPCQQMKKEVIPEAKRTGVLDGVIFHTLDVDKDAGICRLLLRQIGNDGLPAFARFQKVDGNWKARYHNGYMTVDQLRDFLDRRTE